MEDRIIFLLEKAKFELDKKEFTKFAEDYKNFKEDLKLFDSFDLTNIEELRQPFEKNENFLRDDKIEEADECGILENASKTKDGYIFLEVDDK